MLSGSLLNNNKIITTPPVIRNICISQDPKNGPEQFYAMHQGQATSLIAKGINSTVQTDSFTGEGVVEDNGRKLVFEDYTELFGSIGSTAKQLYIALSIEIPGSRNNTIRLPLDKYMEMRRLKNKKEIRKQVKADLKTLASIRIEFKEKRRGEEVGYLNMRLFGGTEGIMNGVIVFKFNTDFLDLVRKYNVSPLPMGLLTINQNKNRNSFYFLYKISNHKSMNRNKLNADIIGVMTLLESTPIIPKYEDIKDQGRINQRIIEPFERDMDAIRDTLKWQYCGTNGTQIVPPTNYEEFSKALIKIAWNNYPERKEHPKKNKRKETPKTSKEGGSDDI